MASVSHDLSIFHLVSAAGTNATLIKTKGTTAGAPPNQDGVRLYGWFIFNSSASMRKVAFHDVGVTPTAGSNILFTLCIPGNSAANVGFEDAIKFANGLAITTVTGVNDSDASGVGGNDLNINLYYR